MGNNILDESMTATLPLPDTEEAVDLFALLERTALLLWKDWPRDMQVSTSNVSQSLVTLRGKCPHCGEPSVFMLVTSLGNAPNGNRIAGMQCQGCLDYILGVFTNNQSYGFTYIKHFPLGKPDENVAPEIPDHIQEDFKEALRCMFVNAYNATAEMCRRALEASCIERGSPINLKVLEDKIDWLEEHRKITPDLKEAAHKVRLGGNRGAHPPEGGPATKEPEPNAPIEKIEKEHAEAIVDFTRHFFQYVYVIPKQLDKYDFSKPKMPKP